MSQKVVKKAKLSYHNSDPLQDFRLTRKHPISLGRAFFVFQLSEVSNRFPDSRFEHVWIILGIIFCAWDSSRIQEKVENMKNLKLQMLPQSWKKQVEKRFKIVQNLEKWMIFDKSDRYYPIVLGFFPLFWVNFGVASVIFSIFTKKPDARTKFEKSRLFTKKIFFLKIDRWVILGIFFSIFFQTSIMITQNL